MDPGLSETEIINLVRSQVFRDSAMSMDLKDDCALINSAQNLILTTDTMLEGSHFRTSWMSAKDLGWKALATNLSDLASKGARPKAFLLSLSLPAPVEEPWLRSFLEGLDECARKYSCPLIGGNTVRSEHGLSVTITALGEATQLPLKARYLAQSGDLICVTGPLGDALAGFDVLEKELFGYESLRQKHLRPEPRLLEGQWLSGQSGVHAMMDISDGFRSDVVKMAEASGLGFEVDIEEMPHSPEFAKYTSDMEWPLQSVAASGGEDYEILCAIEAKQFESLASEFLSRFGKPLRTVGMFSGDLEHQWKNDDGGRVKIGDLK